jgi:hypothetical protein
MVVRDRTARANSMWRNDIGYNLVAWSWLAMVRLGQSLGSV